MTKKSVTRICSLENCIQTAEKRGYCGKHYVRWRKYGNATKSAILRGTGKTFGERFWSRVAITADDTKCWNWLGRPDAHGYGQVILKGQCKRATHGA